ncbi:MAG TPA: kelch repeat-containing protein [Candidatus Limnocylindrales bacterium]
MTVPRQGHSSTRLNDGTVLIVGGTSSDGSALPTAELYDPAMGKFKATGSMSEGHSGHMTTLLENGRVLIVGGYGHNGTLASAELYDPATGKFTETGSMSKPRGEAVEALLPDGRVLVAGGQADGTNKDARLASAEIYDPAKETFSPTGSMRTARVDATATPLPNGKILVAGGYDAQGYLPSAELYDPATGVFTATGSMSHNLVGLTATLLKDGRVLVAGGESACRSADPDHACVGVESNSAELYDPGTGKFTKTGSMSSGRILPTATLLNDGRVLIAGGFTHGTGPYNSAELYDPSTGSFSDAGSMGARRGYHTATLLTGGLVLIAGGTNAGGNECLSAAELFRP